MKLVRCGLIGVVLAVAFAIDASAQQLWSNPATWGGRVPGPGEHVVIPQARRIVLDVSPPPLGSITVLGVLAFASQDVDLTVGWIMVHGMLEIGTEQIPYAHRATITLDGPLDEDVMGMGGRFIGAMHGGRLEIHGSRRADVDWALLAATARPGDTSFDVDLSEPNKPALGWRPGDLLAVAPSGRDPLQAEAVVITAVSGTRVSFTPPLQFTHFGELQTIAGRTLDERAEVGLLTRNIVIQGAPDGFARQMGGHVMVMAGSIGRLEGVELRHMGQMGRKGRYPIHWHLTGYAPIDYARFNSVWNSFHRAIALHQTHGVEVRGNVAANVWSHTYVVAEDGNEVRNVVEDNLGILTKRLPDGAFAFGPAGAPGPQTQDEWRPATFWVNNANNVVRRNRAAGGLDAIGFYYDNDHGRAAPGDITAVDFSDNVAHSYLASNPGADPMPDTIAGVGLMVRMAPRGGGGTSFDRFTAYHNSIAGVWLEDDGDVLRDAVLADNGSGAVVFRATVERALVVGQTANTITAHPVDAVRGGIRIVGHGGAAVPKVRQTTFVRQEPAAVVVESGALTPGNLFENTTLIETAVPVSLRDRTAGHTWSGALHDVDGTLTGADHASLVTGHPLSSSSTFMPGWGTFAPGGAFLTPYALSAGPSGLSSTVEGTTVTLGWHPPADASALHTYVLEAGSAPGRVDLLQSPVGLVTTQTLAGVPAGRYFVRVRGLGADGPTPASNEVAVVVGQPSCYVPDTPAPLTYQRDGNTVRLAWSFATGATGFLVGVGSAPGRYDLLVTSVPAGTPSLTAIAPPGLYFVQVAALNACGLSALSNEVSIAVP